MLIKYKNFNQLTKNDMKQIVGGNVPDNPAGGGEGGCWYMCCWNGTTTNCSLCVPVPNTANASCVTGAYLVLCVGSCD
jgi:bacteriocin-like protein